MRHPVIEWSELAEAVTETGEVNVALFAGVETFTLTHADANIGSEIMHTTIRGFHRITLLLLEGGCAQRWGSSEVNCASGRVFRSGA